MSDERFNRLENKLDLLHEKVDDMKSRVERELAIYNEQLKIHIEATDLNRQEIKRVEKENVDAIKEVKAEIVPIKEHVIKVQSLGHYLMLSGKAVVALLSVAGVVYSAIKLLFK